MSLLTQLTAGLTQYQDISCDKNIKDTDPVDIAVIIPVHGRTDYNRPVCDYFYRSVLFLKKQSNFEFKISITIVEHSDFPQHKDICRPFVNYIHIPLNGGRFNKCLCHNIGAIAMQKANFFLFHDIDIIVPANYFIALMDNLFRKNEERGYDALQTFTTRRLLLCNEVLTQSVLNDSHIVNDFSLSNKNVSPAKPGAAGGSIIINKSAFIKVGGWNDIFFTEYSLEDQFFFDKMELLMQVGFANKPPIELLHLDHPPSFNRTTKDSDLEVYNAWTNLSANEKQAFIEIEHNHLKKYINE